MNNIEIFLNEIKANIKEIDDGLEKCIKDITIPAKRCRQLDFFKNFVNYELVNYIMICKSFNFNLEGNNITGIISILDNPLTNNINSILFYFLLKELNSKYGNDFDKMNVIVEREKLIEVVKDIYEN